MLDPRRGPVGEFAPALRHRHLLLREDAMSPISTSSVCSLIGISPLIVGCSVAAPTPPPKPRTALFSPSLLRSRRVSPAKRCKNPKLSDVRSLRLTFSLSQNRSACRAFRPSVLRRARTMLPCDSHCNAAEDLESARLGRRTLSFG
jgi:hypothetical protein